MAVIVRTAVDEPGHVLRVPVEGGRNFRERGAALMFDRAYAIGDLGVSLAR